MPPSEMQLRGTAESTDVEVHQRTSSESMTQRRNAIVVREAATDTTTTATATTTSRVDEAIRTDATMSKTEMSQQHSNAYVLTRKVLAHHNLPNNAWVAFRGAVYDITTFIATHPGGAAVLDPYLGKDITDVMPGGTGNNAGDVPYQQLHQHSAFAFKLLEKHRIGTLADAAPGSVAQDGNVDPRTGEQLVRWDRPILHQIGMLGDKYERWIHSFPTTDHTVKMFANDTIESLTKCPWYVPLLFWTPVLALEMLRYVHLIGGVANMNPVIFLLAGVAGGICWLLFEYSLHRWVFHMETSGYWANIFHFLIHGHHHITPMDFDRLVFPPVPALIIGAPFWALAPRVLGTHLGYPWLAGFLIGYLVYDMTHFWIHHGLPSGAFLKMQKRRHVHHHYFKPYVNFGISNPLFDVVFRTLDEPQ